MQQAIVKVSPVKFLFISKETSPDSLVGASPDALVEISYLTKSVRTSMPDLSSRRGHGSLHPSYCCVEMRLEAHE